MPSAISNLFQCSIERFSSGDIPYLKIDPDLPAAESNLKHTSNIQLAYSAREGTEHYDSCIDSTTENDDEATEDESTVETDEHSGRKDNSSDIIILGGENVKDMATDLSDSGSNKIMSTDVLSMPNDVIVKSNDIITSDVDDFSSDFDEFSPDADYFTSDVDDFSSVVDDLGDVMSNDATNLSDDWTELMRKADIRED